MTLRRRRLLLALALVLVAATTCTTSHPGSNRTNTTTTASSGTVSSGPSPTGLPTGADLAHFQRLACSLPHRYLVRLWRGYFPGRGGELQLIPREPDYMGDSFPHAGPWDYLERVPFLLYGPGYVKPVGKIDRPALWTDWAPTQGALLGFHHKFPDGRPLLDALVPASQRRTPPRLIMTLIVDGGGRDVLSTWPDTWPNLRALIPKGAWYENMTVGSAPTSTAQAHSTLGTGAWPSHDGIVGNHVRIHGKVIDPWRKGPAYLLLPTLADLYDKAMGNRPLVGTVADWSWHIGMMGHGSYWPGGDKDIAVLHGESHADWNLLPPEQPYYAFPKWANSDYPPLSHYFPVADASDGKVDGLWEGLSIPDQNRGFDTPARIPYQTTLVKALLTRYHFGQHDVPDLFYTNYKEVDEIGHLWSMNNPEMRDSLKVQDDQLPIIIRSLNRLVGPGKWVLMVSADHGSQRNPTATGSFKISTVRLRDLVERRFDMNGSKVPVVESLQPTHMFVDLEELARNGSTLADMSKFIMRTYEGELAAPDSIVKPGHQNDSPWAAVFPSQLLFDLPCLPEAHRG